MKGSFGVIINNTEILEKAKYYTQTFGNEVRHYELNLDNKYLVIEDFKV
ncbi:hypothetical protein VQL36_11295 [Chengkuizengella sp. SCS-71B]